MARDLRACWPDSQDHELCEVFEFVFLYLFMYAIVEVYEHFGIVRINWNHVNLITV